MQLLDLSANSLKNIGASILSKCIHNVDGLMIAKCDIVEEGVNALAEQIRKRDSPVCS